MKHFVLCTLLLMSNAVMAAYQSSYDTIEWEQRGNDSFYCLDITDEQGNIAYGLRSIVCGDNLHQFSAKEYVRNVFDGVDLPVGFSFFWKVWSETGYGQVGFEGQVVVGDVACQGLDYSSTAQVLQWGCRQQDVHYCVDILNANGALLYQGIACGDGLHAYSPEQLNLSAGNYTWKIWSASGYGQAGFEGNFQVGEDSSAVAIGGKLYAFNCASCHGSNPAVNGRDGIDKAVNPSVIRQAINRNKGGMFFLNFLSDMDLENIAAYVQNPQ
jgi:hypothetical protein